jgi:hypothetical protein
MKIVQRFQTDDGKCFDDRDLARHHEIEVEAVAAMMKLIAVSLTTGRSESICRQILFEQQAFTKILSTYRKKLPKTLQEEAAAA